MAHKMAFLFSLLVSWNSFSDLVKAQCILDPKFIEESNRVLFTHDEYGNNKLHLHMTVARNQKLFVACLDDHTIESVVCDEKHFQPALPTTYCPIPKASVRTIQTNVRGITDYSVGYTIDAHTYLELYRTSYKTPRVVSTKHFEFQFEFI